MNGIYKKLIAIPVVIIIISLYLIGANLLKRIDRVDEVADVVPTSQTNQEEVQKTEEEEDKELDAIADKININTATESELMLLDGIGETLAARIVARRENVGTFTSVDQLLEIEGLGEAKFNDIKDFVTIE